MEAWRFCLLPERMSLVGLLDCLDHRFVNPESRNQTVIFCFHHLTFNRSPTHLKVMVTQRQASNT